jgi:hypothetical protein
MKRFAVALTAALAAVVVLLPGTRALAHHSFAVSYLESDMVDIEGDVVEFQWRNPHSWVFVQGSEPFGQPKIYAGEWVSTSQLDRNDIDKKWFKPGDRVHIWFAPNKNPNDNRVHLKRIERKSDGWKWQGNRGDLR